jgi:hypothetical protein
MFLSTEVWWEYWSIRVRRCWRSSQTLRRWLLCHYELPLPLKTEVRIALRLDDQTKTWSDGIVISSHPDAGMGIKFLGLSRHNREAVERRIKRIKKTVGCSFAVSPLLLSRNGSSAASAKRLRICKAILTPPTSFRFAVINPGHLVTKSERDCKSLSPEASTG